MACGSAPWLARLRNIILSHRTSQPAHAISSMTPARLIRRPTCALDLTVYRVGIPWSLPPSMSSNSYTRVREALWTRSGIPGWRSALDNGDLASSAEAAHMLLPSAAAHLSLMTAAAWLPRARRLRPRVRLRARSSGREAPGSVRFGSVRRGATKFDLLR
ncbi:hypothetical protein BV25DRAFT_364600 [Artomyces pyxidatus]|uniref:Uncharacterized protein n=1 Tax=Artomyces pyxidatus TaxID=48021 RepID=A0ACB8T6N4_9AGAM|nr:hypothetical protein BV25DRAFT_364600 [Artomyces pyxidatus]